MSIGKSLIELLLKGAKVQLAFINGERISKDDYIYLCESDDSTFICYSGFCSLIDRLYINDVINTLEYHKLSDFLNNDLKRYSPNPTSPYWWKMNDWKSRVSSLELYIEEHYGE